ncbi:outer membrane protein [Piscirickettsia salmonis]|uniref:outer membrane protein n=1 Tax=Piscirickettsia salmonis TaxID=1238 RepID=UPI0007C8C458|nr:OmpA-like transmembrane domain protein [Piscirickettsiaceae bacterium NZ-RLO1]
MMKKILIAASVTAALGLSGTAIAGGGPLGMPAGHGVYLEGALGWVSQSGLPSQSQLSSTKADESNFGGRVAVGYMYDIDPMWGIGGEIGYGMYGETDYGIGDMKSSAWDVSAVGTWHIAPQFNVFAKAGMAYNDLAVSVGTGHVDETKWQPLLGIGAGYNFNPHLQVNLTYTHVFGDSFDTGSVTLDPPELNSVLLGLRYTF